MMLERKKMGSACSLEVQAARTGFGRSVQRGVDFGDIRQICGASAKLSASLDSQ